MTAEGEGPAQPHGGFEVEHFRPAKRYPKLASNYKNLYWACRLCNGRKSDSWPEIEEAKKGFGFVDPCEHAIGQHIEIDGFDARAKSRLGEYTIDAIGLNSAAHRQRRKERAEMEAQIQTLAQLAEVKGLADLKEDALRLWERLSGKPWDAPPDCRCADSIGAKR